MINFDDILIKNIKRHNPNWEQIRDHLYKILIIGRSGSVKTNSLLNLISQQQDIDKIYLYAKDPYEAKYQLLIDKHESKGFRCCNDSKALLNTRMIWMIFIKILKNTIQIRIVKY